MTNRRAASTFAATLTLVLLGSTAGAAAPGEWEGPQVIDDQNPGNLRGLAANADGVFALWGNGSLRVAHRDPGPGEAWSPPRILERSGNNLLVSGPVLALPRGGAVVFATVDAAERTYTWRVSTDGMPAPRRKFPFELFTPATADVTAGGRWLVAGTYQSVEGHAYMAVRSAAGSWRVSERLPAQREELAGAWFDRGGVPHIMVTAARDGSGGYPIVEARLRPDGSWSSPREVARMEDWDRPAVVANADGDVALAYRDRLGQSREVTKVIIRPFGGTWSDPVQFRQESPALAIDELGRTFVVRAGGEVFAGRIGPRGALVDGWQQLTDDNFDNDFIGRQNLTNSPYGVAVVGVVGQLTTPEGTSRIERYVRCLPGLACTRVGDFPLGENGGHHELASGPAGGVWAVSSYTPPCENGQRLCSWRLPAPPPTR